MMMMMMESTSTPSPEEDLLSQLPGDVLVSILEKLSLRDAIRARVLSRRWRCLSGQLSRLDLDIASFLPDEAHNFHDHDDGADHDPAPAAAVENAAAVNGNNDSYRDVFSESGDQMADVAATLLAPRPAGGGDGDDNNDDNNKKKNNSSVADAAVYNTLRMRFYLRHNYMSLGRLLDAAVSSGKVRKVALTITTTLRIFDDDDHRTRAENNHRTLTGYGRRFKALFDACPAAFGSQLTELTLEKMRLQGGPDGLDAVLAACTRLEKLTLKYCGPERGRLWRVRHAWLKHIYIIMCFPRAIELAWLPRLEKFYLDGWFWTTDWLVSLGHVPQLSMIAMSGNIGAEDATFRLSPMFANSTAGALSDLRLNFGGNNIWVRPETSRRLTAAFSNLKYLKLKNINRECGLAWTMFLLQSAPHLQQLYIMLMDHNCGDLASSRKNVPWQVDYSFKHYNLARVTIARFYSTQDAIVTFIRRLIETAVNLEEICFRENAVLVCKYCDLADPEAGLKFPRTDQERDAFTKRIVTDDDGRSTSAVKIHIRSQ